MKGILREINCLTTFILSVHVISVHGTSDRTVAKSKSRDNTRCHLEDLNSPKFTGLGLLTACVRRNAVCKLILGGMRQHKSSAWQPRRRQKQLNATFVCTHVVPSTTSSMLSSSLSMIALPLLFIRGIIVCCRGSFSSAELTVAGAQCLTSSAQNAQHRFPAYTRALCSGAESFQRIGSLGQFASINQFKNDSLICLSLHQNFDREPEEKIWFHCFGFR